MRNILFTIPFLVILVLFKTASATEAQQTRCQELAGAADTAPLPFAEPDPSQIKAGPVKAGIDPFPDELAAMEKLRNQPDRDRVNNLAAVRNRIAHHLMTAETKFSGEGLELAMLYAESATQLSPNEAKYWGTLWQAADTMYRQTNFFPASLVAENAIENVVRLKPDDFSAHLSLAKTLLADESWKEALDHFETALKLEPTALSPALINMMNICYLAAPQTQRGVNLYQDLLTKHPKLDYLRFSAAILYKHQQNSMAAEQMVLAVIKRPDVSSENKEYGQRLLQFWNEEMLTDMEGAK